MSTGLPLPVDPDVRSAPAGLALAPALAGGDLVGLPRLQGLEPELLARWLYRAWLGTQTRWAPLVHLEVTHVPLLGPEQLAWVSELAAGGWLSLGPGVDFRVPGGEEILRRAGIRLLRHGSGAAVPLHSSALRRIQFLDRSHLSATDPTLAPARAAVLAHCRVGGHLLLQGPAGGGKRSLARWAHAQLDEDVLQAITAEQAVRADPGGWRLFEEIERLSAEQLECVARSADSEADYWREAPPPREAGALRPRGAAFAPLLGESAALAAVLHRAAKYAPSALPILVRGPTGSGKELLARAVHEASRRTGRYVAIDLSAQSETLMESALFGHVRGAFTGADRERTGAFREARGGTLFLDELGNLSPGVQAKLLRVLEARVVQPVGSDQIYEVDVRVVAATNADLEAMVRRGEFREDLLFRFNPSATLHLPALRERPEDIVPLAARFYAVASGVEPTGEWISPAAREVLEGWPWPGNVRELRHVMEAAAVEASGEVVEPRHLGVLAPRRQRAAPTLVTTCEADADRWKVRASVRQQLVAVTVRVPSLSDRGGLAVRNAVLAQLGGRLIRPEAMEAMVRRNWRGNGRELSQLCRALRERPAGDITRPDIAGLMPEALAGR